MKPRTKTIIERLGFQDPDRKSPKHDQIQFWVRNNLRHVLKSVFPEKEIPSFDDIPVSLEYPVTDRNYVIGFVDVYCQQYNLGIEIKTQIESVGELLRQINFYRNYLGKGTWIVVSPDGRFAKVLQDQGVHFYKYSSQTELF